jgi:hypothetical protein
MDVFGFSLSTEQGTSGSVTLYDVVDNVVTSINTIQIGWEVAPKDVRRLAHPSVCYVDGG